MPPAELAHESFAEFKVAIEKLCALAIERQKNLYTLPTVGSSDIVKRGAEILPGAAPEQGWGLEKSTNFMLDEIASLLNPGQAAGRYFGFVTGGTLPSALIADWFTTLFDQNVQVHLPNETLSTVIEALAVQMIVRLLDLDPSQFTGTITTGATSSNLLALTCARERTIQHCVERRTGTAGWSTAEFGLSGVGALPVKVFVCQAHASIKKTAALCGIGRNNVIDVSKESEQRQSSVQTLEFDLDRLEASLKECHDAKEPAVVVVGMGEVVTGALTDQIPQLRALCDKYDAWLHLDAAFSAFVCLVDGYHWISSHMGACDSITSDGHKALNVPYDCGILLIKKHRATSETCLLDDVCGPGNGGGPSYLTSTSSHDDNDTSETGYVYSLPSPLHRNVENSRRFRALPLYVSLLSQGRDGTKSMILRNLLFAQKVRSWIEACPYYQLLVPVCSSPLDQNQLDQPQKWKGHWNTTIVFFRAHPERCPVDCFKDAQSGHLRLIEAIKETRKIYVSPGSLNGVGGVRIAVSNWSTGVEGDYDYDVTTAALSHVMTAK
jgi:glutamate/tyrosine decarboxylase-like PLP-dependent enzyme